MLELGLECEQYNSLPYSGGVMDQPAGLLKKLRQCVNVYTAFRLYKQGGNKPGEMAKWKKEHEDVWDIISEVQELRVKHG